MGEITVDPKGVTKLLNNLNIHKAPGPDGLSARVLKEGSVSASGTGRIRLESPRPAMPDAEPILTGMAACTALHFSYQFLGCK